MLAFDFCGYEGFKSRFGFMEHGNGTKSRRNKILLSYIKNPSLLREARLTGDFSLLNIQNMTELKNIMFERIMDSGIHTPSLSHKVELINYTFWSSKYQTDKNKGLCEDGDFKSCRYINYDNNGKVFKMKAGRFIRAIIQETSFGQSLPEQVLIYLQECFVQEWQTFTMSTLPKNHLSVNKDFERIYDSSQCNGDFHSCMVNKGLHTFYRDAVDASAAYLQNEEGKIMARCIIYNKVHEEGSDKIWRLAERQYSTEQNDILKRALVDALIREGMIDGYKQVGFDCHNSRGFVDIEGHSLEDKRFWISCNLETDDTLSYQDSFKWYCYDDGIAYNYDNGHYDYNLDSTEGSIDGYSDDDIDEENYDEYHNCYGYFSLVSVYHNGEWMDCSEDDLDDFEHIEGIGWVHEADIAECPICGRKYIASEAHHSETTNDYYCSSACLSQAEIEYQESHKKELLLEVA